MRISCSIIGTAVILLARESHAFVAAPPRSFTSSTFFSSSSSSLSSTTTTTETEISYETKRINNNEEYLMDVASFRNNLISPELMISKQQAKQDAIDPIQSAIKGVGKGVAIGLVLGGLAFMDTNKISEAIRFGGVSGGSIAVILGANNFIGNRGVHVPKLDEARNRLIVDFVESIKAGFDIGFGSYITPSSSIDSTLNGRFVPTHGLVGCLDCQLRNSKDSVTKSVYGQLPPHVHIKNVEVDTLMRRQGIALSLVQAAEEYARTETDAEVITLLVDDTNFPAIELYQKAGFKAESIGTPNAKAKYGVFTLGRSIMIKNIA